MRKDVNGRIVDIDNIEMFIGAMDGIVLDEKASSDVDIDIEDIDKFKDVIKKYSIVYKSMPYPLYGIQDDIKYVVIGEFIKACSDIEYNMWVDKGLYVEIDGKAIRFINRTWGVIKGYIIRKDNIQIDKYKDSIGYKEFKWFLDNILDVEDNTNFYERFMGDFIEACDNKPDIIQRELNDILNIYEVPNRVILKENVIKDLDKDVEYLLDIYSNGVRRTGEYEYKFSFNSDDLDSSPKYAKAYKVDCYEKANSSKCRNGEDKIKEVDILGLNKLFKKLDIIRQSEESNIFKTFRGVVIDRHIIFQIENRVFISKLYRESGIDEIGSDMEIYACESGILYLVNTKDIGKGIRRESIYSFSIKDYTKKLCRVQYSNN